MPTGLPPSEIKILGNVVAQYKQKINFQHRLLNIFEKAKISQTVSTYTSFKILFKTVQFSFLIPKSSKVFLESTFLCCKLKFQQLVRLKIRSNEIRQLQSYQDNTDKCTYGGYNFQFVFFFNFLNVLICFIQQSLLMNNSIQDLRITHVFSEDGFYEHIFIKIPWEYLVDMNIDI